MVKRTLGIGFVGAGFMNRFHVASLAGVRDCEVAGVWSPTRDHAELLAAQARDLGVGGPVVRGSLRELVADPAVDALWIATTNDSRVEVVEEILSHEDFFLPRIPPRPAPRSRGGRISRRD